VISRPPPPAPSASHHPQARKLESEIDRKLSDYAKLAQSSGAGVSDALLHSDGVDATSAAIQSLLQRLSDVNRAMSGATAGGEARTHVLARHRDILAEFTHEHRRVGKIVEANRDREALIGGGRGGGGNGGGGFVEDGGADALLRERGSIHSSTSKVDEVIGQATATAAALINQREIFSRVGDNLGQMGDRFPVVQNLMSAIKRKKSKDTIVLSVVTAMCVGFILIYWMSK
jgi:Golgi SNAP receptor complex protein 1